MKQWFSGIANVAKRIKDRFNGNVVKFSDKETGGKKIISAEKAKSYDFRDKNITHVPDGMQFETAKFGGDYRFPTQISSNLKDVVFEEGCEIEGLEVERLQPNVFATREILLWDNVKLTGKRGDGNHISFNNVVLANSKVSGFSCFWSRNVASKGSEFSDLGSAEFFQFAAENVERRGECKRTTFSGIMGNAVIDNSEPLYGGGVKATPIINDLNCDTLSTRSDIAIRNAEFGSPNGASSANRSSQVRIGNDVTIRDDNGNIQAFDDYFAQQKKRDIMQRRMEMMPQKSR
jgi:hypothetical protein